MGQAAYYLLGASYVASYVNILIKTIHNRDDVVSARSEDSDLLRIEELLDARGSGLDQPLYRWDIGDPLVLDVPADEAG